MSNQPSLTSFDEKLLIWSVASQLGLFCSGATLQEALNNSSRWIRAHEHLLQSGPGDFNSTNVVSWMQQSKLILPRPVPQHAQNIVSFISTIQYTILMPLPLPKHMSWNCPAMPFTLSREWVESISNLFSISPDDINNISFELLSYWPRAGGEVWYCSQHTLVSDEARGNEIQSLALSELWIKTGQLRKWMGSMNWFWHLTMSDPGSGII